MIPTKGAIIPAAVGVDIGCGMMAVPTTCKVSAQQLKYPSPMGGPVTAAWCDRGNHANNFGTLGTGNHFIEVCLHESDTVWFMLHSGSCGVGNRIGNYFIDLARKDMKKFFINPWLSY